MRTLRISRLHEATLPYHVAAAISAALALSFAAGVASASAYPSAAAEAHAEALTIDLLSLTPLEYFPGQ